MGGQGGNNLEHEAVFVIAERPLLPVVEFKQHKIDFPQRRRFSHYKSHVYFPVGRDLKYVQVCLLLLLVLAQRVYLRM